MKHIIDDADKNKYEAYTKEEVLEVIQEAISSGELPEEINGLVLTFKNPVYNQAYKIAFCTQAKYNELVAGGLIEENCYYFITDDTSYDDLENAIATLQSGVNQHTNDIEDIKEDISDINDDITSLDGRIDTLEGIHLYRHDIRFYLGSSHMAVCSLYLNVDSELTNVTLANYISSGIDVFATGFYKSTPNADPKVVISLSRDNSNWKVTTIDNVDFNIDSTTTISGAFYDTVTQIY